MNGAGTAPRAARLLPAACCLPAGGEPEPRRQHPVGGEPQKGGAGPHRGAPGTLLLPVPLQERRVRTPFRRLRSRPRREGTWLMGGVERAADCFWDNV